MLVALDLDDVLLDYVPAFFRFLNHKYHTTLTLERFNNSNYQIWECWEGTKEDAMGKFAEFSQSPEFLSMPPMKGVASALALAQHHKFIIITGRSPIQEHITYQQLALHFPYGFEEVYFTDHHQVSGSHRNKATLCKELRVELFIEDNLNTACEAALKGIPTLLYDRPWNKAEFIAGVKRVFDWEKIAAHYLTPREW